MNEIVTIIIAHEDFSSALLHTVEKIMGPQQGVFAFSNRQDSLPVLAQKIKNIIQQQQSGKVVVFVDLMGGSCWNLAGMLQHEYPHLVTISGVNVPMLISYFTYLNELPFAELMAKIIQDAARGITRLEK
jgi:mannose PTS system EIIA component